MQGSIVRTLRGYDAVIAYGVGPIYAALAGVPFLAQTWGGDMTIIPFRDMPPGERGEATEPEQSRPHPTRYDASLARLQRWGLSRAHRVLLTDPRFFPFAERIGLGATSVFLPFVMDTGKYSPGEEPELRAELLGADGRTLLFVPSRLDFHWKGSDRMLRGVAAAMQEDPGIVLACAGWGVDPRELQHLAGELGITERVRFLPNAFSKTRLLRYYRAADVVLDQFEVGSYGSSALEAMSVGRPLLMYLDPERFARVFGTPPLVNVREPEEIGAALVRLAREPAEREQVGREQRAWVVANQGNHLADEAHALLVDAVRARAIRRPREGAAAPALRPDAGLRARRGGRLAGRPHHPARLRARARTGGSGARDRRGRGLGPRHRRRPGPGLGVQRSYYDYPEESRRHAAGARDGGRHRTLDRPAADRADVAFAGPITRRCSTTRATTRS